MRSLARDSCEARGSRLSAVPACCFAACGPAPETLRERFHVREIHARNRANRSRGHGACRKSTRGQLRRRLASAVTSFRNDDARSHNVCAVHTESKPMDRSGFSTRAEMFQLATTRSRDANLAASGPAERLPDHSADDTRKRRHDALVSFFQQVEGCLAMIASSARHRTRETTLQHHRFTCDLLRGRMRIARNVEALLAHPVQVLGEEFEVRPQLPHHVECVVDAHRVRHVRAWSRRGRETPRASGSPGCCAGAAADARRAYPRTFRRAPCPDSGRARVDELDMRKERVGARRALPPGAMQHAVVVVAVEQVIARVMEVPEPPRVRIDHVDADRRFRMRAVIRDAARMSGR